MVEAEFGSDSDSDSDSGKEFEELADSAAAEGERESPNRKLDSFEPREVEQGVESIERREDD